MPWCSEDVAIDTVMSDMPAVDDDSTMAQFFLGRDTLVCDVYCIKTHFINTLADNVRKRGAMETLISDGGSYEVSKKVTDFLRSLLIADYLSEPYHQHQNKAEQYYGTTKHWTNTVMDLSGTQHSVGCCASNMCPFCSTSQLLPHLEVFAPSKHHLASFLTCLSFSISTYMSLSTTRLIKMSQIMLFLLHPMRRKHLGMVLLKTLEID